MIRELFRIDDPAYCGFLELFIESFHAWGREPVPVLTQILRERENPNREPYYRKWVAEDESGVIGMIRGAYLPTAGAGFVVHIAVSKSTRGKGVARQLLAAAEGGFQDDAKGRLYQGLVFEVERIQDAKTDRERDIDAARLMFFDRIGARLVTPNYTQPPMGSWLPEMPLNLLIRPTVDLLHLRDLVKGFYADAFGFSANHPYVERACVGVSGRLESPLMHVADTISIHEQL